VARVLGLSPGAIDADTDPVHGATPTLEFRPDRFGLDSVLLLAYGICFLLVTGLMPLDRQVVWSEAGPALGLQVAVALLLRFGPRLRPDRRRWLGLLGITMYLTSVALLRDGGAPTAGYGPLVLLPVVWASLRGDGRELLTALAGVAGVYLVPELVVGPPHYPVGGWRSGLLFVVISAIIGLALRRLVARLDDLFERLDELARTDELTGLPNRRAWQELLRHESAVARRTGQPFTVGLIDLDGFKQYNDSRGHLAGDRLLRAATAAWRKVLRDTDVVARWGGDEFVLLLPGCTAQQAEGLVARMREAFPEVVFSIGLADSVDSPAPEALLGIADHDLYEAKRGRPGAPATLRADADHEPASPQGPGKPEEEARHAGLEVR